jgi:hypothetical protein
MSKEIKFRAWHNGLNQMLPNIQNHIGNDGWAFGQLLNSPDNIPVMQYSGVKDINSKEIYENDVVKINEAQRRYVVKFHNGCFKLFHADPKLNDMIWGAIERVSELLWSLEVVGNIYENPELLSEQS